MAKYIRGIDVAHWEPEIDWMKLRAQEIRFAFIKATQAADYVDNKFLSHWTGAKQAGILRGAYHFIDPRVDGRLQAENFLRTVKLEPGDLPPVLDLEDLPATPTVIPKAAAGRKSGKDVNTGSRPGKGPATVTRAANSQMIACAEVWLRLVEQETGRKPIIYSGPAFLNSRMTDAKGAIPAWASKYMLWLANYLNHPIGDNDLPWQPKGWANWTFWQYSESGMIDGIYNEGRASLTAVDLNFFRGTLEELYVLAGAAMPAGGVAEQPKVEVISPKVQEKVVDDAPVNDTPEPEIVSGPMTYCIEAGDTLFELAMRFHTTVDAILAINPQITDANFIRAGENITIPQAG